MAISGAGSRRGWLLLAAAVCAALLGGSALAWACTQDANIQLNPQSGPPGTEVEVVGGDFAPDNLVELHWDDGTVLGTARGPVFTTTVVIPEGAELGQHTIVGLQANANAKGPGIAPQPFVVTAAPQNQPNSNPGGGGSGNEPNAGGSSSGDADGGARPSDDGQRTPVIQRELTQSGRTVFAGSAPVESVRAPKGRDDRQGGNVSERTAISDPATGYSAGTAPSLGSGSLAIEGDRSQTPFAFGLALLATGLLALLGGMVLVLAKRRKAPAKKDARPV